MKAKYLHCSMAGSHYVPCTILEQRPWRADYMTSSEKDFGKHTITTKQYFIEYYDWVEDVVVGKWVNDCYVKVGKV